jgi:hypothetical protein
MSDVPKHEYPSEYPPGTHWSLDEGWEILDMIRPGVIPLDVRALIAGYFGGRLSRERAEPGVVRSPDKRITVRGGDYSYEGYIVAVFLKRRGGVRYVVEDDNGRLFIHNAKQVGLE